MDEPQTLRPKRLFRMSPIILVLGLTSLLTDFSTHMTSPVLPLFLTAVLHVQMGEVGIIEGIAESSASILKLFSGWLADRVGKRKLLMLAGYGLSNLTKPFFAVSGSWLQVLLVRFADRIGKGIRVSPRDSLLADAAPGAERGKAFGFRRAMDTLGAALGPLAAFAILAWFTGNYRLVFWLSAVPGLAAVALLFLFLREDRSADSRPVDLPRWGFNGLGRRFFLFSAICSLFTLGNFSDAFLALRAQAVGMSPAYVPLAFLAFNLTTSLFSVPVGMLSDRIGRKTILVTGFLIFAAIYLGFGMAESVRLIWVLFAVYGLYYAFTEGIQKACIADMVPAGRRGVAMGTFNALTGIAALPASIIAGFLWQTYGSFAAFSTGSALAALAAVLLVVLRL